MKILKNSLYLITGVSLFLNACELSDVTNPYVTEDRFISSSQSMDTWLNGARRQASLTVGTVVEFTELVSDNYFNNYTQSSKVFDNPELNYFDRDVTNIQASINKLIEMSEFGLTKFSYAATGPESQKKAELLFYKAYAYILGAELYVGIPVEPLGEVYSPVQLLESAIDILTESESLYTTVSDKDACSLLIARCYYRMGNVAAATTYAQKVIGNPMLLRQVKYGTQSGPSNNFQSAIFSNTTNWFAPLPRLDFLDPKYFHQTTAIFDDEKPIAIAKAEEAYLILAEAQAAKQDLVSVKKTLKDLLENTVKKRPVVQLDDKKDTRNGGNRKDYPLTAVWVKFDAQSPVKSSLVMDRAKSTIPAYSVSATHIQIADIDAIDKQDDALYLIYLLRQEIFIAEGRRMTDLGIRFPVSQREQLNNTHVTEQHIKAIIPSFIPLNRGLDDFTYDKAKDIVTMAYDMNKVLVQNKTSAYIMPFNKK